MLLPKQCWKDIEGYEGLYQVSNTGRVRSLNYKRTGKTKVLKQGTDKDDYKKVVLCKDGKNKVYLVHRLVALAFIPNPNNYPMINHKDENRINNAVWNLEWCTQQYNCNYGNRNKKISKAIMGRTFTEEHKKKMSENHADFKGKNSSRYGKGKSILMFTLDGEFIRKFDCVADANEYLGKPRNNNNICQCAKGGSKTAWGYIWKYEEDC